MITITEPGALSEAPDYDNPLGLIKACHKRILFHCDLLEKVMAYLDLNKVDKNVMDAARLISHYFNTAGKLHHQDEEKDIFPRLISVSTKLADIINTLEQGHQSIDKLWTKISPLLENLEIITPTQLPELKQSCTEFCQFNLQHMQFEEKELFSVASNLISNDQLKLIGQSMKRRRHIT